MLLEIVPLGESPAADLALCVGGNAEVDCLDVQLELFLLAKRLSALVVPESQVEGFDVGVKVVSGGKCFPTDITFMLLEPRVDGLSVEVELLVGAEELATDFALWPLAYARIA